MRNLNTNHDPSLAADLGSLAGLYRTVFWMIGRKAKYGRLWPAEAEMAAPDDGHFGAEAPPVMEAQRPHLVEVTSQD